MTVQQLQADTVRLHLPAAATADICDTNPGARVLLSWFHSFGGMSRCAGPVDIVATRDDNSLVKKVLQEAGNGKVLLVDNHASVSCAMVGGGLAQLAAENGWAGIVVNGAVRDVAELIGIPIGVFALASNPRRSINRGIGERNQAIRVGTELVTPGDYLVADSDGVVLLAARATLGHTL